MAEMPYCDPCLPVEERLADLLSHMTLEEKIAQTSIFPTMTNILVEGDLERNEATRAQLAHGIGGMGRPGLHAGARETALAIGLASTWDPEMVQAVFMVAAREMRVRGENWALTPVLDLAREPRWGRTEETYGEDPFLGARIGVAAVRGLQGVSLAGEAKPIDKYHVLATAKHFASHGQPEGGRNCAPANIAERELRENYLKAFQAAVMEAGQ